MNTLFRKILTLPQPPSLWAGVHPVPTSAPGKTSQHLISSKRGWRPWKVPADLDQVTHPHGPQQVPKPFPGLGTVGRGAGCLAGATLGSLISAIFKLCLKMALKNGWGERAASRRGCTCSAINTAPSGR